MTNINKLFTFYDVHSHKEQENLKDLLENHLPKQYTDLVIDKLKQDGIEVSSSVIRNVKHGLNKNQLVFAAILEVASEKKVIADRIKTSLSSDLKDAV